MNFIDHSTVQLTATACFVLAILHTFSVHFFNKLAHRFRPGSFRENIFHLLGEVEVVFGLWAGLFILISSLTIGFESARVYLESRNFTEPILVFVLMAICSTKPVLTFAESLISFCAKLLPFTPHKSFYISSLIIGPLLGSFITEPAAMTVTALLLLERYYQKGVSRKFMYATLGLLFVNISIGGTLTPYAAPPVLMVAAKWNWDLVFMLTHFGWKAALAVAVNTALVTFLLKDEFKDKQVLASDHAKLSGKKIPLWVTMLHLLFLVFIVINHHHVVIFFGAFLFFLGVHVATQEYQSPLQLKTPLLVSFFLGGLIVLGGPQGWWLQPLLGQMSELSLYLGALTLTAFTDNAAITYLGSQVEGLSDLSRYVLVAGSVVGGGLTVIANAPNPAGYSLLNKCFGDKGIEPAALFKSALLPTLIAALSFWFLP